MRIDVGGYHLAVDLSAGTQPTTVFISGRGDGRTVWANLFPLLRTGTATVTYDRAGIGDSDPHPSPASRPLSALVDELVALLERLPVQGPFVVVAHSLGAVIARMWAARYPTHIAGLVLIDGSVDEVVLWPGVTTRDGTNPAASHFDYQTVAAELAHANYPAVPSVVLTRTPGGDWLGAPDAAAVDQRWTQHQHAIADRLHAVLLVAANSGHYIQHEAAALTALAIDAVIDAFRVGDRLVTLTAEQTAAAGGLQAPGATTLHAPPERLGDERVILRRLQPDDDRMLADAVTASHQQIGRWLAIKSPYTMSDATEFINLSTRQWAEHDSYTYAIVTVTGLLVGCIHARRYPGDPEMSLGYWLDTRHTGRGYATMAVKLLTRAVRQAGARSVRIQHDEANTASGAVAHRAGFTCVGTVPDTKPRFGDRTGVEVLWRYPPAAHTPYQTRSEEAATGGVGGFHAAAPSPAVHIGLMYPPESPRAPLTPKAAETIMDNDVPKPLRRKVPNRARARPVGLLIRPETPDDVVQVVDAHIASWRAGHGHLLTADQLDRIDPDEWVQRRRDAANRSDTLTFVAIIGSEIVGHVTVGTTPDTQSTGQVFACYVHPDQFGAGVADELLRHGLQHLSPDVVRLWVAAGNGRAIAFYTRHGFRPDGVRTTYESNGTGAILELIRMTLQRV